MLQRSADPVSYSWPAQIGIKASTVSLQHPHLFLVLDRSLEKLSYGGICLIF